MVDDLLSESRLNKRGIFQPDAVRSLVQQHRTGAQDWSMQIWQLLTLEIWMEQFIDKNSKNVESPTTEGLHQSSLLNGWRAARM
jgi:asparagine synthase (glutamine-hydrolysing)